MPRSQRLTILIISLWGVYFIRAHNILALPVFVDESLHILRAQVVFDFSDGVASFLPGKLLLYYYLGLFAPENQNGLWVSRAAVALFAPLSAALSYAIVYAFTRSFRAGIITIWLYATSPLMIFFERMAMADTFALTFALGLVLLMARHPRRLGAGLLLGLALLAKLTALPLVAVPVLAMRRHLAVIYGVTILTVLLPSAYAVYQEVDSPPQKAEIVTSDLFIPEDRSRLAQIGHNIQHFAAGLRGFGGAIPVIIVLSLLGIGFQPRVSAYLLMILALAWGFLIVVSAFPTTRYLTLTFPLFLILFAIQFEEKPLILFSGVIVALLGVAFIADVWRDPTQIRLGDQDEWEYFRHTSSGYALREAADEIFTLDDTPLIAGFVGSCHSLRLYGSDARDYLLCPLFPFDDNPALATPDRWLDQFHQRGAAYALVEEVGEAAFAKYDFNARLLETFARPHGGESLKLYKITP